MKELAAEPPLPPHYHHHIHTVSSFCSSPNLSFHYVLSFPFHFLASHLRLLWSNFSFAHLLFHPITFFHPSIDHDFLFLLFSPVPYSTTSYNSPAPFLISLFKLIGLLPPSSPHSFPLHPCSNQQSLTLLLPFLCFVPSFLLSSFHLSICLAQLPGWWFQM